MILDTIFTPMGIKAMKKGQEKIFVMIWKLTFFPTSTAVHAQSAEQKDRMLSKCAKKSEG